MKAQHARSASTFVRVAIWIALAISGVSLLFLRDRVLAEDDVSRVEPDGALHIRELTIPPSDMWSPEFKAVYAKWVNDVSSSQMPARNASKADWDRFYALDNKAGVLARLLQQYSVGVEDTTIADVHVGIISPTEGVSPANRRRVLINLHAGGFVYGRGINAGQIESIPVAAIGRIKVITVDYRQAPFHGYPAASEDVEAVYRELLRKHRSEAIGIYGCSAGGALTAQTVTRLQAKGLPLPGAIGIFCSAPSPTWTRRKGDSGMWLSADGRLPKSEISEADRAAFKPIDWYMEGADSYDPQAYPETSDAILAKFPDTLFLSGTRAFEMSAVIAAHARFLRLGVDSSLYIMEGGPHGAHVIAPTTPEAHDTNAYIAHWFDQHLAP